MDTTLFIPLIGQAVDFNKIDRVDFRMNPIYVWEIIAFIDGQWVARRTVTLVDWTRNTDLISFRDALMDEGWYYTATDTVECFTKAPFPISAVTDPTGWRALNVQGLHNVR